MATSKISSLKVEAFLRFLAFLTLFLAAMLMVLDSQTKLFFGYYQFTANYKLVLIAKMFVYVHFIGAGYTLIQLVRCLVFSNHQENKLSLSGHSLKWSYFTLDQMAVYIVFATNCAITEMAFLVLLGQDDFQWMKLCNRYTKFCVQIGASITFGLISFILLAIISSISTFNLFRWYSPNFLCLKPKKIGIAAPAC